MSQSKATKIHVRNRAGSEGRLTVGANTEVLIDGVRLRGCQSIKFECHARKLAKVTIEVLAEVEIEAVTGDLKIARVRGTPYKTKDGKLLAVNTLSNYSPTQIVTKEE